MRQSSRKECDGISEGNIICAGSLRDLPQLALEFISCKYICCVCVRVTEETTKDDTPSP